MLVCIVLLHETENNLKKNDFCYRKSYGSIKTVVGTYFFQVYWQYQLISLFRFFFFNLNYLNSFGNFLLLIICTNGKWRKLKCQYYSERCGETIYKNIFFSDFHLKISKKKIPNNQRHICQSNRFDQSMMMIMTR